MSLIEDIITCVNVHASAPKAKFASIGSTASPNDIYLFAYKELSIYLRYLFIAYDNAVKIDFKNLSDWPWYIIASDANNDPYIDEIWIVTYNYDIWLERVLNSAGIPFSISIIQNPTPLPNIRILKPHGSISFAHHLTRDPAAFQIAYDRELPDAPASEFKVTYDKLNQYYLVSAMIPPAGDSGRFNQRWANEIRNKIREVAKGITRAVPPHIILPNMLPNISPFVV